MKCMVCGKNLDTEVPLAGRGSHLRGCYKNKDILDMTPYVYNTLQNYPFLTRDFLYKEYIEEGKSFFDIVSEYLPNENPNNRITGGTGRNLLERLLKYYNIPIRNVKESKNQTRCINKTSKTNIERYGGENPLNGKSPARRKAEKTMMEKYGVLNIFSLPDFEKRYAEPGYLKNLGISKGEFSSKTNKRWWASLTKEEQHSFMRKTLLSGNRSSSLEKKVSNALFDLGLSFETQFPIKNRKKGQGIHDWYFDFHIKSTPILIEVNGDFWHGNPNKYLATDINCKVDLSFSEIWEKDKRKKEDAEYLKYKVITLWESDILLQEKNNNLKEYIFEKIKEDLINENFAYQINYIT